MCIGSPKQISSDDIIKTWLLDPYECEIPIYCALCLSSDIGYDVTNAWNGVEHQSLCLCVGACLFVAIESCKTERDWQSSRMRERKPVPIVKSNEWNEKRLCALWLNIELALLVAAHPKHRRSRRLKEGPHSILLLCYTVIWKCVYLLTLTHLQTLTHSLTEVPS